MAKRFEERLQIGLGVRRPDLADKAAPVTPRWKIDLTAGPLHVRAVVIHQVRHVIQAAVADPRARELLDVAYNLTPSPEHSHLNLTGRLLLLADKRNLSVSRMNTKLSEIREGVVRRLTGDLLAPSRSAIEQLVRREEEYERTPSAQKREVSRAVIPEDLFTAMVAESAGPSRTALEKVLVDATVHFALSERGTMVLRRTSDFGEVACVFTSAALLAEHQLRVGAPASDLGRSAVGRELIRTVVRDGTVGLVLNPPSGRSWTADELAVL